MDIIFFILFVLTPLTIGGISLISLAFIVANSYHNLILNRNLVNSKAPVCIDADLTDVDTQQVLDFDIGLNPVYYASDNIITRFPKDSGFTHSVSFCRSMWQFFPGLSKQHFPNGSPLPEDKLKMINEKLLVMPVVNRDKFLNCLKLMCGDNKAAMSFSILCYMLNHVHDDDWTKWEEVKGFDHFVIDIEHHLSNVWSYDNKIYALYAYLRTGSYIKSYFVDLKYMTINVFNIVWFSIREVWFLIGKKA